MSCQITCYCCNKNLLWKDATRLDEISYGDIDDLPGNKFICESCKSNHCNNCGAKDGSSNFINATGNFKNDIYGNLSCAPCRKAKEDRYDRYVLDPW